MVFHNYGYVHNIPTQGQLPYIHTQYDLFLLHIIFLIDLCLSS